jgi:hypothetical protein
LARRRPRARDLGDIFTRALQNDSGEPVKWTIDFRRHTGALVLATSTVSCSGYTADYTFQAGAERTPARAVTGSGKVALAVKDMRLTDEFGEFSWRMSDSAIGLTISNRSRTALRILWDDARFVDDTATLQSLLVDGPYAGDPRGSWHPQSGHLGTFTVNPGTNATFRLFPKDYATVYPGHPDYPYWFGTRALFMSPGPGGGTPRTRKAIVSLAPAVVGKTVTFRIPAAVGDSAYDYSFRFTVSNVRARVRFDIGM